ncbi:hypothetical protein GCM10020220_100690 [Nonomuraea rubra]
MQDPGPVDGRQGGRRTDRQPLQGRTPPRPLVDDQLAQGRPRHELADDVRPAPVQVGVEHRSGAEPGDALRHRHLAQEARPGVGVRHEGVVQQLDRDLFPGVALAQINNALAALAEPGDDVIRPQPPRIVRRQRLELIHVGPPSQPNR